MATKRQARATGGTIDGGATVEQQLDSFIDKFDPAIAALVRACRAVLGERFSTAFELVYDNYNALAIGFCASERASSCIVSLAVYPNNVALSFYYGATLKDSDGLLQGSGNQNRYIRLPSAAKLREPGVAALIEAAIAQSEIGLPATGHVRTIIKSVSAKQRPRRPVA